MDFHVFLGRMELYFRQQITVEEILMEDPWSMYPLDEGDGRVSTHENDNESIRNDESNYSLNVENDFIDVFIDSFMMVDKEETPCDKLT